MSFLFTGVWSTTPSTIMRGIRVLGRFSAVLRSQLRCSSTADAARSLDRLEQEGHCTLCDAPFSSWLAHSTSPAHVARHTVCTAIVMPERHEALMKQLWDHIHMDFAAIDEVTTKKEARRRGRLTSTVEYLQKQNVLRDSIIQSKTSEAPDVATDDSASGSSSSSSTRFELVASERFEALHVVGKAFAEHEVLDRVMRLLPGVNGTAAHATMRFLLSTRNLARTFHFLRFETLLKFPVDQLRSEEQAAMVIAMLGELQLYSREKRSRSVAEKKAADALVLNVLGTHAMDNIISELTYDVLQRIVDEGTPVWLKYQEELSDMNTRGWKAPPLPLMTQKFPAPGCTESCAAETQTAWDALIGLVALETSGAHPRSPKLNVNSTDLIRASSLDITVPRTPQRTSVYAPCMPKLVMKKK